MESLREYIKKELIDVYNYSQAFESTGGHSGSDLVDFAINKIEPILKEKDNEIAKLRKMIAKNHHLECGCSFCKSVGFIYGGRN